MRWWVIALGLAALALLMYWGAWVEYAMVTPLGSLALIMPALFLLVALAGLNALWRRVRPTSRGLSRAELLALYIMPACTLPVLSFGMVANLVPYAAAPFRDGTPESGLSVFHPYLSRRLAQADPAAVLGLHEGHSSVPWAAWLPVLGSWLPFLGAILLSCLGLNLLFFHHWHREERLTFPVSSIPLQITEPARSLFRQPLFWLPLGAVLVLRSLDQLSVLFPVIPRISAREYNLGPGLPPPWNSYLGYLPVSFHPMFIGILYLAPTDLLFSCWFFHYALVAQGALGAALGLAPQGAQAGFVPMVFPYPNEQNAGAAFGLAAISVTSLLRARRVPARGRTERAPAFAWPLALFAGGVLFMAAFCALGGLGWALGAAIVIIYWVCALYVARVRAQVGTTQVFPPSLNAHELVGSIVGEGTLPPRTLGNLALFSWFTMLPSGNPIGWQLDSLRMGEAAGIPRRAVVTLIALASALALPLALASAVHIWHRVGLENPLGGAATWHNTWGRGAFTRASTLLQTHPPPSPTALWGIALGLVLALSLSALRMRFHWWPLHPLGYAMAMTWSVWGYASCYMIAWGAKVLVLRYGGISLYRASLAGALGLILGDMGAIAIWTLASQLFGFRALQFYG